MSIKVLFRRLRSFLFPSKERKPEIFHDENIKQELEVAKKRVLLKGLVGCSISEYLDSQTNRDTLVTTLGFESDLESSKGSESSNDSESDVDLAETPETDETDESTLVSKVVPAPAQTCTAITNLNCSEIAKKASYTDQEKAVLVCNIVRSMNSDSTEPEIDWAYVVAQHGKRFKSNGSAARSHDALAKQFQCIKKDNGYTNEKLSNAELKVKLITDYKIELEDCTPENVYDATPIRHSKVDMDSHLTKRDGVIAAEYIVAAVNRLGRTVEKTRKAFELKKASFFHKENAQRFFAEQIEKRSLLIREYELTAAFIDYIVNSATKVFAEASRKHEEVSRLARNRHAEAVEWRKVALEAAAKMIRMEKEKEELRAQICALTKLNEVELADATAKIILLEKKEEELLAQMQERTEFHEETLARELAELTAKHEKHIHQLNAELQAACQARDTEAAKVRELVLKLAELRDNISCVEVALEYFLSPGADKNDLVNTLQFVRGMCAADPKIKAFLDENVSVYYDRTDDSDTEIIVVKPHSDEEQFNMRYSHVIDELITLPTFATAI